MDILQIIEQKKRPAPEKQPSPYPLLRAETSYEIFSAQQHEKCRPKDSEHVARGYVALLIEQQDHAHCQDQQAAHQPRM
jgi:hypothetical protein